MSELEIPEGRVAVQRLNSPCYLPMDGVTLEPGDIWHLPAAEAAEQLAHPFPEWGPAPAAAAKSKAPKRTADDPGQAPELPEQPADGVATAKSV